MVSVKSSVSERYSEFAVCATWVCALLIVWKLKSARSNGRLGCAGLDICMSCCILKCVFWFCFCFYFIHSLFWCEKAAAFSFVALC